MKNKVNIILIILLALLLGGLGFFSYKLLFKEEKTLVPDFSESTVSEINTWCKSLETNPCTFENEYSDVVEKDHLIYQSISPDAELSDSITFIISLGKQLNIAAPEIKEGTTIEEIEAWVKENRLTNVTYTAQESDTVERNRIISISPAVVNSLDAQVTVIYSSGKKGSTENIDVEYGSMLNISEADFKEKTKKLGLTPTYDADRDDYSDTIKKGNIVWHGSGSYVKDEIIHYGISKGVDENSIKVEKYDYVGLTLEEFKTAVGKLGTKGLTANHNESMDAYSSSVTKGNVVEHGSGSYAEQEKISYGLSLGPKDGEIIISGGTYVDETFDSFKTAVEALNLKPLHKESWDVEDNTKTAGKIAKHGSGSYEKDENISYGVYVNTAKASDYEIKKDKYAGKTYEEFENAVKVLGLTPVHRSEWDVKDNSKKNNTISRNGEGTYVKGENISYGLYISDSSEKPTSGIVTIKSNEYAGKTLAEFKTSVEKLGLTAEKSTSHLDDYSSTYPEGTILWHGSGEWDLSDPNDRVIHYSLSKGNKTPVKTVTVASGHENDTEVNFKSYITGLGLTCSKSGTTYSDSIAKGGIIYTAGTYNEGANVAYYISNGPDTRLNVTSYAGKTKTEFLSFLSSKGLVAGTESSEDSKTVEIGSIVRNDTGTFNKGDSINYTVSTGISLGTFEVISANETNTFEGSKTAITNYLKMLGFTNITINGVTVIGDDQLGIVQSIKVNGTTIVAGKYSYNVPIVIDICNKVE